MYSSQKRLSIFVAFAVFSENENLAGLSLIPPTRPTQLVQAAVSALYQ